MWSLELLIVVAIIYLCTKMHFIFSPIGIFISAIFTPILISGFLYYMLNPIIKLLMKIKISKRKHVSRNWAVTIVFLLMIGIIIYILLSFLPHLISQVSNLIANIPHFTKMTETTVSKISKNNRNPYVGQFASKIQNYLYGYAQTFLSGFANSVGKIISMATSVVVMIVTVPVILFYMLKDGYKFIPSIERFIPKKHRSQTIKLLRKMSDTISHYIGGQMIECLFVGTFVSLGYFLIGQKYALLLGVFAGICNIMPYVGPYVGIIPSILVALSMSITQTIYVIIIVIIVQQIDGNLIYPNVIGKSLQIHPLTIIILLLASGNIAGLLGMILVIPVYAVIKVIIQYLYNIWQIQHEHDLNKFKL